MPFKPRFGSMLLIAAILAANLSACSATQPTQGKRPNIVIILTDDMDLKLMPFMEKTNALIGQQGATFTNYFVTTPLCCPSRSSMLRGQYAHNTDILENTPGFARFYKLREEESTLAVWLEQSGYKTSLIGKYLNNYPINAGQNYVPPGWTDWHAFLTRKVEGDLYYNYTMNENGKLVEYGGAPQDYSTDVIKDKSLAFIQSSTAAGAPFFLLISVYGPHGPSTAAPRHEGLFDDLIYPLAPSFYEEDLSDKPQIVQRLTQTGDDFDENDANHSFRTRARSLQSVDELVAEVVAELEQSGQLENTYIFFLSDNGFHLGEHRIPSGKGTAYEEDIHVPLMVRGPGIDPGSQVTQMTANIDLAPTIAEITGVSAPEFVDGRSFLPCLKDKTLNLRSGLLFEFGYPAEGQSSNVQNISLQVGNSAEIPADPEKDNLFVDIEGGSFRAVRTDTFIYVEYENGETEYYDLVNDPYELDNIASQLDPARLASLHDWLTGFKACKADECRKFDSSVPENLSK